MYLYRVDDTNNINIYALTADEEKLKEFKRNEFECIPSTQRFMEHTTNKHKMYSKNGIITECQYDKDGTILGLGYSDIFSFQKESDTTIDLTQRFINNNFEGLAANKLYKLIDKENKENRTYFLVTEYYENPYKKATLHNIMVLTKSLYVIRCLETGRYDLLKDEDITKELELFDINFVDYIDGESVEDLQKYGLISDAKETVQSKIEESTDVITLKLK